MATSSKDLRLKRVNLSGSMQIFGMTTQYLVDGYNGLLIYLQDGGYVHVTFGGVSYVISPASWTAAELWEQPKPEVVVAPTQAEPEFERVDNGEERISIKDIKKRQKQKMLDRMGDA